MNDLDLTKPQTLRDIKALTATSDSGMSYIDLFPDCPKRVPKDPAVFENDLLNLVLLPDKYNGPTEFDNQQA